MRRRWQRMSWLSRVSVVVLLVALVLLVVESAIVEISDLAEGHPDKPKVCRNLDWVPGSDDGSEFIPCP